MGCYSAGDVTAEGAGLVLACWSIGVPGGFEGTSRHG